MRLIEADALEMALMFSAEAYNTLDEEELYFVISYIDETPTIDAVSVVRRGECKHSETSEDNSFYCKHWDDHFGFFWDEVNADDFCSYGERKDHE